MTAAKKRNRAWPRKPRKPKEAPEERCYAVTTSTGTMRVRAESPPTPETIAALDGIAKAAAEMLDERPAILRLAHGLHADVAGDAYYARTPGIASKSVLDLVRQSPAHYAAWLAAAAPERETPALAFGQALHCAILEPERFARAYAVRPATDGRTKEGKEARARWVEEHPGAKALTEEDARTIGGMVASVLRNEMAAALLVDGAAEVTARWRDEGTGVECKGRADYWSESISTLVDVKTCEDASPAVFKRKLAEYGLHRQSAMYLDGWRAAGAEAESFVLLCIEKAPPYAIALYEPTFDAVMKGRSSIREDLETLARCQESGIWPGYSADIVKLDLPAWATW